ncbi:hypothetical protein DL93DRAFT_1085894 [Clavulina sp. PMI_390]|nr:hypothetical protein DL93DRAFT_1085894 [Clavulina sp. PMI_390]
MSRWYSIRHTLNLTRPLLLSLALLAYIRRTGLHNLHHPPQSPTGAPLGDPIQYATQVALFWFAYVTTSRVLFLCEPYSQYHEFQVSEITTVLPVFLVDVRQMGWAAWDGRPHTLMELVYSPLEPTLLFNPFIRSILDRLMEREHCCLKFELPTQLPVEIFATLAQRLRNSPPPLFPVTPTAPSPTTSLWLVLESLSSASPPYDPHSAVACLEAVNRAILLSQHSVVAHNVVRLTHPLILLGQLVEILRRNAFRLSSSTIASIVDSLTNIGAYMTSNLPSRIMAGNQSIPSTQEWKAAAVNIQAFLCMPTSGGALILPYLL